MGLCDQDILFPHFCFSCGETLLYAHVFHNAFIKCPQASYIKRRYKIQQVEFSKIFDKWWSDNRVKFLCCHCIKDNLDDMILKNQIREEHRNDYDFVMTIGEKEGVLILKKMDSDNCTDIIHAETHQDIKFNVTFMFGVCPKCAVRLMPESYALYQCENCGYEVARYE